MTIETHSATAHVTMTIGAPTDPTDDLVAEVRLAARWANPADRKAIRLACGLSQARLAETLGVQQTTVQRWENGTRNPRGPMADRYFRCLTDLADVGPNA